MTETAFTVGFDVPFTEAIKAATTRGVVLPEIYYGVLQGIARQLAFSIASVSAYDQLQRVRDSLAVAMATGQSFNAWKKEAAVMDLNLPDHRLDNIFRTNLQGNYMRGRWEQFVRNAEVLPYLIYDAINDSRVRPSHLAHDGVIRPVFDPFWDSHSPPLSWRCRCSLNPLSESRAKRLSGYDKDGAGTGLNKTPMMKDGTPAQPDKGWDYNPAQDRLEPILKAIRNRSEQGTAAPEMLSALDAMVAASFARLFSEWIAEHGREDAEALWRKHFGDKEMPNVA